MEYNEFVGAVGPADGNEVTELHVRYGVRNDRYVDWSIALNIRIGTLADYLASGGKPLHRRRYQRIELVNSTVRRSHFNPANPDQPPVVETLHRLARGQYQDADGCYHQAMYELSRCFEDQYAAMNIRPDRNTQATFGFANHNRKPEFRARYHWLANTIVSLESDNVEEALMERGGAYFPGLDRTAAVWFADRSRLNFIKAPRSTVSPASGEDVIRAGAAQRVTMGMACDMVNLQQDWADLLLA
ncbi:hypothetical protein [Nocardia sp. NPDC057668]|uniref:hypothetical protein n=1 Tax=Nocardia sp. NPDC057668 TaxID=3346202 RepID=UPI003672D3B0